MNNKVVDPLVAKNADLLTVVILAYNRCGEVLITLKKLEKYRSAHLMSFQIIVVDNASIDDTALQVAMQFTDVILIVRDKNNGIAGWNEGFSIVNSKFILVLDDDSCIQSGLADALAYLEIHPEVGILGLDIVDEHLKGDPDLDPEKAWKHLEKIPGFIGCGAIIRTDVYHKIGGYAEWIYVYTHEFEYTIRCIAAGYQVVFFNKAVVVHRASKLNRSNKRLRVFGTRNELAIVYRYFKTQKRKYLWRVLLNNLKFIKREGWQSGFYILSGAYQFLKLTKRLERTPVSQETQNFYAANFWSTKPIFKNDK